jgi:hypothetical protein
MGTGVGLLASAGCGAAGSVVGDVISRGTIDQGTAVAGAVGAVGGFVGGGLFGKVGPNVQSKLAAAGQPVQRRAPAVQPLESRTAGSADVWRGAVGRGDRLRPRPGQGLAEEQTAVWLRLVRIDRHPYRG